MCVRQLHISEKSHFPVSTVINDDVTFIFKNRTIVIWHGILLLKYCVFWNV